MHSPNAKSLPKHQEPGAASTAAFPGKDLFFDDGTSFIETMSALLGRESGHSFGPYSMLNVNAGLKSEMRRVNYWKNN